MAKRVKQLEAEAADLQASWDAERRELLRRELLTSQLCDLMVPYLRPGCPFRDIAAMRAAATWCDELGRWRLPDVSPHISLPPAASTARADILHLASSSSSKADHNNNSNNSSNDENENGQNNDNEEDGGRNVEGHKGWNVVNNYFRRSRVDTLLAHAREAKTFGKKSYHVRESVHIICMLYIYNNKYNRTVMSDDICLEKYLRSKLDLGSPIIILLYEFV